MIPAVADRRSIRKYKRNEVPQDAIEEILKSGILAPSSKNRQPWKFIVVRGKAKDCMTAVMEQGIAREKQTPLLPESAKYLSGAEYTAQIMKQAPVVIFIVNSLGRDLHAQLSPEERVYEICNAQSIGAAIENMTLTATALGLGSLWICDTFFAHAELKEWLNAEGEPFAALAVGYADEAPSPRPRNGEKDTVEWRE